MREVKAFFESISGGVQATTETHSLGYDTNLDCRCICECFDSDTKNISDEAEAGFLARWLWYYPSAFASNTFYGLIYRL